MIDVRGQVMKGKKSRVFGLARSGLAVAEALKRGGARVGLG